MTLSFIILGSLFVGSELLGLNPKIKANSIYEVVSAGIRIAFLRFSMFLRK